MVNGKKILLTKRDLLLICLNMFSFLIFSINNINNVPMKSLKNVVTIEFDVTFLINKPSVPIKIQEIIALNKAIGFTLFIKQSFIESQLDLKTNHHGS